MQCYHEDYYPIVWCRVVSFRVPVAIHTNSGVEAVKFVNVKLVHVGEVESKI